VLSFLVFNRSKIVIGKQNSLKQARTIEFTETTKNEHLKGSLYVHPGSKLFTIKLTNRQELYNLY